MLATQTWWRGGEEAAAAGGEDDADGSWLRAELIPEKKQQQQRHSALLGYSGWMALVPASGIHQEVVFNKLYKYYDTYISTTC